MIRVLVVDDSALMRGLLSAMLASDPEIEVVGAASDPLVARQLIKSRNPDVLTLDIEMPRLDGLEFLRHLMRLRPMPVVMVSSQTRAGAEKTLRALEFGAVDVVAKPTSQGAEGMQILAVELIAKVKAAACAHLRTVPAVEPPPLASPPAPKSSSYDSSRAASTSTRQVIAIGASAGGVPALTAILAELPLDTPPVLVAQHMPPGFTRTFANRLDRICSLTIMEAHDGTPLRRGHVYIAPGDFHLTVSQILGRLSCRLSRGELVCGHRPSVDVLFESVAQVVGSNAVGVLLTGMGKDGAQGLLSMRQAGGTTICQDEASSLVYGMPRAAKALGAVEHELTLSAIPSFIVNSLQNGPSRVAS